MSSVKHNFHLLIAIMYLLHKKYDLSDYISVNYPETLFENIICHTQISRALSPLLDVLSRTLRRAAIIAKSRIIFEIEFAEGLAFMLSTRSIVFKSLAYARLSTIESNKYKQAIAIRQYFPDIYCDMGIIYDERGLLEKAKIYYEMAI
ncbi:hypothetical protein QTP88_007426 [Uroleucon formosanum]